MSLGRVKREPSLGLTQTELIHRGGPEPRGTWHPGEQSRDEI